MEQTAVPDIDLRRLHQAFPHVRVVGPQSSDEEVCFEEIHRALHRVVADPQGPGQARPVQQPPLLRRQHRQQGVELGRGLSGSEPRQVALDECAHVLIHPVVPRGIRLGEQRVRKATPVPQGLQRNPRNLRRQKRRQLDHSHPSRQGLRDVSDQRRIHRSQQVELAHSLAILVDPAA